MTFSEDIVINVIGIAKVKHCFSLLVQFSNSYISGGTGPPEMSHMPAMDTSITGHDGRKRSDDLGLRTSKMGHLEHAMPGIILKLEKVLASCDCAYKYIFR